VERRWREVQISRTDRRRTAGNWDIQTFSAGKCQLDIFWEGDVPLSYIFRCDDVLYAPDVNIVQDRDKGKVNIDFSYSRVFADIGRVKRVEDITKEIREFFLACQEEGILDIVNIEEATG